MSRQPSQAVPEPSARAMNNNQRPKRIVNSSSGSQTLEQSDSGQGDSSAIETQPIPSAPAGQHSAPPRQILGGSKRKRSDQPRRGRGINIGDPMVTREEDKIWIEIDPIGRCFMDEERIKRTVSVHVKLQLDAAFPNWSSADSLQKQKFWNAFTSTYRWDHEYDKLVGDLWVKMISKSMSGTFSRMHTNWEEGAIIPEWIPEHIFEGFITHWQSPEFQKQSEAGSKNRAQGPKITHTTGSVSIRRFRTRLEQATGRTSIPQDEVYMLTRVHRPKGTLTIDTSATPKWVNDTCKEDYDKYVQHCEETYGDDRSSWPEFDSQGWIKATGAPKKGKIRGIPAIADPEDYNIPVPRRRASFPGEISYMRPNFSQLQEETKELRNIIEERDRKHEEEKKDMMEQIKKLQEQLLNPEQIQNMMTQQLARMREEEQRKQDDAFRSFIGQDISNNIDPTGKFTYPQGDGAAFNDYESDDELNY